MKLKSPCLAIAFAAASMLCSPAVSIASAKEVMPVAQQNALVQKYCAVCHTDAIRNGGLSLEHFNAAQVAPSLAAMMLSKLTAGVLLETVRAAAFDPVAAALIANTMKGGAMGAAGLPIPDKATIDALIDALAFEATGATGWYVNRTPDPATKAEVLTASILRELPSTDHAGTARLYRLVVACNSANHQGGMQLAWAPAPKTGMLSASVDGTVPATYTVEGTEKMGNGTGVIAGPAAITLYESGGHAQFPGMRMPAKTLGIKNLFPGESVEFPFASLPRAARQSLASCFSQSVSRE